LCFCGSCVAKFANPIFGGAFICERELTCGITGEAS
jgi:hypothetical protein